MSSYIHLDQKRIAAVRAGQMTALRMDNYNTVGTVLIVKESPDLKLKISKIQWVRLLKINAYELSQEGYSGLMEFEESWDDEYGSRPFMTVSDNPYVWRIEFAVINDKPTISATDWESQHQERVLAHHGLERFNNGCDSIDALADAYNETLAMLAYSFKFMARCHLNKSGIDYDAMKNKDLEEIGDHLVEQCLFEPIELKGRKHYREIKK